MRDGTGRWGRVLVLGGTSELGLAVVDALDLQPRAEVLLAGRDLDALAAAPLPDGVRRTCLHWDATSPGAAAAVTDAATQGGDLDLVVAAAGILGLGAHEDAGLAAEVLMTNTAGLIEALVTLAGRLRSQRHGTVVVLSSVAAVRPRRSNYVYGASKAGLDAFAQGLADDLHSTGVRVLVVRPGFVHGRMTAGLPAAPMATSPEDVGRAVRLALDRGRSTVWVPAALRWVAPVLTFVPRPIWRRLDL
ncbi:MAG: decaprenylphospho-beta-D-erythro-pentofuranosid-2-ulose 2-reductase [Frankiales bacterium]|nr:decaprenylphospho-beta-D-erythro-pentofuranosid-2-ulose 2-reductase [Frankiales bacterium]